MAKNINTFSVFYALKKHGFLTDQSIRTVLSIILIIIPGKS